MAEPVESSQSSDLHDRGSGGVAPSVTATTMQQRRPGAPVFVFDYAPLLWLSGSDLYMPSDIAAQVAHTIPKVKGVAVAEAPSPLTLDNLDQLNALGGRDVWLTSEEGIQAYPKWFYGVAPDENHKTNGAISCAIVTVDKGKGILDAFYFYFFAFNKGNTVLGIEFGSHVGDWEHNMIRFQDGIPQAVFFSQHASSQSFTYRAVEKMGRRPVAYVAEGSHAVYGTTGTHDHTIPHLNLPAGLVEDHCDRGNLWDPTLSTFLYSYDVASQKFTPDDDTTPVNWLYFVGRWGDDAPPRNSPGQIDVFGQKRYVGGPTGPIDKRLDRKNMSGVEGDDWIWPFLTV